MSPGRHDVQVCNPDGQCSTLPDGFTVTGPDPVLVQMVPSQGYYNVPNNVTLYGYNFQPGIVITIGNTLLENIVWVDTTQVQAVVPAGVLTGTYDVIIRNPDYMAAGVLDLGSIAAVASGGGYTALDPAGDDFYATAEDIWTAPTTIRDGDEVMLGVNLRRQGGKVTLEPEVAFYLGDPDSGGVLLGSATAPPMPPGPGGLEAVFIYWDSSGHTGVVEIYMVVDPDDVIPEGSEENNVTSQCIAVLPPAGDESPPSVTDLWLNGGASSTEIPTVTIEITATDTGGSGVSTMYLVEREFNPSAVQWVAIQRTDWIPFQSVYTMELTGRGGVRYVQAWVADGAGNTCITVYKVRVDYVPPSDTVLAGQVFIYRRTLAAGQTLHVTLETLSGDADLYVWRPDGNQSWVSNNAGTELEELSIPIEYPHEGSYQIEVYGYETSNYVLTVDIGQTSQSVKETVTHINNNRPPRTQAAIAPDNVPEGSTFVPMAPMIPIVPQRYLYLPLVMR